MENSVPFLWNDKADLPSNHLMILESPSLAYGFLPLWASDLITSAGGSLLSVKIFR